MSPELLEVIQVAHQRPSVSIIFPLITRINMQKEVSYKIKLAVDKVENELLNTYPNELADVVVKKLRNIQKQIKVDTTKKTCIVFASPVFEKVVYLDIPVEEKIIIDESFEIRDIVYQNTQLSKYLVCEVNGKGSKLYLGDGVSLTQLHSNVPESIYAFVRDAPTRISNFTDITKHKQDHVEKFLLQLDDALGHILHDLPVPLYMIGTEKIIGLFKKLTHHANQIADYIHGNFEESSIKELNAIIKPHVNQFQKSKEKVLLKEIEQAMSAKKCAIGIQEVWKEAMLHKGRKLLVEKNYMCPALRNDHQQLITQPTGLNHRNAYIRDAVDDVIEMILKNGGEVEFVETDVLREFDRIVLIEYY